MDTATANRLRAKITAMLDPTCRAIQENVARLKAVDDRVSWCVEQGLHQIVLVTFDRWGRSTVAPVTAPLPALELLAVVEAMKCAHAITVNDGAER